MTNLHNEIQDMREIAQECETQIRKHLKNDFYVTRDKVRLEVFTDDIQIKVHCQETRLLIIYQNEDAQVITYDNHNPEEIAIITVQHIRQKVQQTVPVGLN